MWIALVPATIFLIAFLDNQQKKENREKEEKKQQQQSEEKKQKEKEKLIEEQKEEEKKRQVKAEEEKKLSLEKQNASFQEQIEDLVQELQKAQNNIIELKQSLEEKERINKTLSAKKKFREYVPTLAGIATILTFLLTIIGI